VSDIPIQRVVCRFSCGGPSAVATKLALAEFGADRVEIVYSDTRSEHPDNKRFLHECEEWFGKSVTVLASSQYENIWDVYRRERFISSHQGASCRAPLKMVPFYDFWRPSDLLIFGFTADGTDVARAERLEANSAERMRFPLIEKRLTRSDCLAMIDRAGIAIPEMYRLGFKNNNCLGCPKGGMGYWNRIRDHFPVEFERMAAIQRDLGPGSGFLTRRGERITLDQLEQGDGRDQPDDGFECSVMCALAEQDIATTPSKDSPHGTD